MLFGKSLLSHNCQLRDPVFTILKEAITAVEPYQAIKKHIQREDNLLHTLEDQYDLEQFASIYVVGAGKAIAPMATAVEEILGRYLTDGVGIVKHGHSKPTEKIKLFEAGHPIPDLAGVKATKRILRLLSKTTPGDLIIVLLSGGASALLEAPAKPIELEHLQAMTSLLLESGATINEINCVRKHCSQVKGGLLAQKASSCTMLTFILSDVVGSPVDVIAGGPTVPDTSTWSNAWEILQKYHLEEKMPTQIVRRIQDGKTRLITETPKPGDKIFCKKSHNIIGDNRLAATAAQQTAQRLGFNTNIVTTYLQGEAQEAAKFIVSIGLEILQSNTPLARPACLIFGGETTVTLNESKGLGGRNQELALAGAIALNNIPMITLVSLATDGTDGPTDGAGGIVDGTTIQRGKAKQLSAIDFLKRHDSYHFLEGVGDLIKTGPTYTNVNDLIFLFIE